MEKDYYPFKNHISLLLSIRSLHNGLGPLEKYLLLLFLIALTDVLHIIINL